jgi:hypothetical protein
VLEHGVHASIGAQTHEVDLGSRQFSLVTFCLKFSLIISMVCLGYNYTNFSFEITLSNLSIKDNSDSYNRRFYTNL